MMTRSRSMVLATLLLSSCGRTLACSWSLNPDTPAPQPRDGDDSNSVVLPGTDWPINQERLKRIANAYDEALGDCGEPDEYTFRCGALDMYAHYDPEKLDKADALARDSVPELMALMYTRKRIVYDSELTAATGVRIRETGGWKLEDGSDRVPELWIQWWRENRDRYVPRKAP